MRHNHISQHSSDNHVVIPILHFVHYLQAFNSQEVNENVYGPYAEEISGHDNEVNIVIIADDDPVTPDGDVNHKCHLAEATPHLLRLLCYGEGG